MMNGITTCIPASFDDRQAAVPRLHCVRLCPRYAANALGDLGAQAARATGFCPRTTAPVRPWPPELAKASSALGGPGALLSAVGQRDRGGRLFGTEPFQPRLAISCKSRK